MKTALKEGPSIAPIAALAGDPARANMLAALMGTPALTAGELAREAGITPQTASSHLAKLEAGGLIAVVQQGRHRYFRMAGADVAETNRACACISSPDALSRKPWSRH